MSDVNNGGPAFPREAYVNPNGVTVRVGSDGMTLRDWFAGQPDITGNLMVMDKEACEVLCGPHPAPEDAIEVFKWQVKVLATLRYIAADAMIAAGAK